MSTGSAGLPGTSTVQINEVARQKSFKCSIEKSEVELNAKQLCSMQFFSMEFARGIRLHEISLL